jgi:hypothetical protein
LGSQKVKYMAVSVRAREPRGETTDEDYLAENLRKELEREGASFDFMVHVQGDEKLHPIEEPDVSWSQNGARTVKLARIEIPAQVVDPHSIRAELIVMSPWNCLKAHEPLGDINLARARVY